MATIILGFQGTGKSWFVNNHSEYDSVDMDYKYYTHDEGWIKKYVNELEGNEDKDFIFCNISAELMQELSDRGISFYIFAPDSTSEDYEDVKSLIIGRCVRRKTQTAHNVGWIERLKRHFDEWCDPTFFQPYLSYGTWLKMSLRDNSIEKVIKNVIKPDYDDLYIKVTDYVIRIYEGTGDNLLDEDISEGYVDYINYDIYAISEPVDINLLDGEDPCDGGMMMLKELIRDRYGSLRECIPDILEMCGFSKDTKYNIIK